MSDLFGNKEIDKSKFYDELRELFDKYGCNTTDAIIDYVAMIFNVDKESMLSHKYSQHFTLARWMCWYALYKFTNQTHRQIGKIFSKNGEIFTESSVCHGANQMREYIDNDADVRRKWKMIEHAFKTDVKVEDDPKITIVVPVGYKDRIRIKEANI